MGLKLYENVSRKNLVGVIDGVGEGVELGRIVGVNVGVSGMKAVLVMTGVTEFSGC